MNRERAKKLLPIIKAYAEGKTIQFARECEQWKDLVEELAYTFPVDDYDYRIKPEPRELWVNFEHNDIVVSLRDTEMEGYTLMREVIE